MCVVDACEHTYDDNFFVHYSCEGADVNIGCSFSLCSECVPHITARGIVLIIGLAALFLFCCLAACIYCCKRRKEPHIIYPPLLQSQPVIQSHECT